MDFWTLLSQYMDGYAVIIAFGLSQFIKLFLPTPTQVGKKWSFAVGPIAYRLMPFLPLIIGIFVVMFKDAWISPTMTWDDALVKGVVSGIAASYAYRTIKVSIFGEQSCKPNGNGNGKPIST